eukprot:COSAG01_NODE_7385_length_3229_cov_9.246645_2_plen_701_part_00
MMGVPMLLGTSDRYSSCHHAMRNAEIHLVSPASQGAGVAQCVVEQLAPALLRRARAHSCTPAPRADGERRPIGRMAYRARSSQLTLLRLMLVVLPPLPLAAAATAADAPPRQRLPSFPFGTYSDPPYGCLFEPGCGGRTDWKKLPEVEVTHGLNFFTPYLSESGGHNASTWAYIEAYLQRAEELGVLVNYALNHLCGGEDNGGCGQDRLAMIEAEVRHVARYKSIYAWYISDEPDGNRVPKAEFAAAVAKVRQLDPRPVSVVLDGATNHTRALPYAAAVDIVMADPYPIGHSTPERVSTVAVATDSVVELIAAATATDGRHRRAIMVPQAFGALGSSWGRNPTRWEGRVMVYLMVMHGSHGILLYARRGPFTMPTNQVLWGEYRAMANEMHEIAPQLLTGARSPVELSLLTHHAGGGDGAGAVVSEMCAVGVDGVHAVQFVTASATVVLVTNAHDDISCSFVATNVTSLTVRSRVEVLFENRWLGSPRSSQSVGIADTISAMGTRAYRVPHTVSAPPPNPTDPKPLLLNGNLEASSSPGVPDGVYAVPTGDLGSTFFTDPRVHAGGGGAAQTGHSLRLRTARAGQGVRLTFVTATKKLSGTRFNLSLAALAASSAANLTVSLASRGDSPSCCDSAPSSIIAVPENSGGEEFQRFEASLDLPAGCTASCEPTVELMSGSTTLWIDDLVLTRTAGGKGAWQV